MSMHPSRQAYVEEEEAADNREDDNEEEPEDDFNAAWEVLEVARAIYEKQQDESDEVKLKLADVYIALGDVSLETGTPSIQTRPTLVLKMCHREVRPGYHGFHCRSSAEDGTSTAILAPNR